MTSRFCWAATLPLLLAAGMVPAAPVSAAGSLTVAASSCGSVTVRNTTTRPYGVHFDNGTTLEELWPGQSRKVTGLAGGGHNWSAHVLGDNLPLAKGWVRVQRCTGGPTVPIDGDENGDGRADLMAVRADTGDLYYYPMTPKGLGPGRKVGHGWQSMVWAQRAGTMPATDHFVRIPGGRRLLAVRKDAEQSIWTFAAPGQGRITAGQQFRATNARGATQFSVLPVHERSVDSPVFLQANGPLLLQERFDHPANVPPGISTEWQDTVQTVGMRDFDGDHWSDLVSVRKDGTMWVQAVEFDGRNGSMKRGQPRQIGHGWGRMDLVMSPGSVDGDALSDIVARRSDGHLYLYRNLGGRWAPPVKIGTNWQKVRLLA